MHRHETRNSGDRFMFVRNHDRDWEWERVDRTGHVVERSARAFQDHADAVADAVRCGFEAEE